MARFIKIYREILERTDLTLTAKVIDACLVDHLGANGVCWPSLVWLARQCSCSESSAMRAINALVAAGFWTRLKSTILTRGESTRYRMGPQHPLRDHRSQNDGDHHSQNDGDHHSQNDGDHHSQNDGDHRSQNDGDHRAIAVKMTAHRRQNDCGTRPIEPDQEERKRRRAPRAKDLVSDPDLKATSAVTGLAGNGKGQPTAGPRPIYQGSGANDLPEAVRDAALSLCEVERHREKRTRGLTELRTADLLRLVDDWGSDAVIAYLRECVADKKTWGEFKNGCGADHRNAVFAKSDTKKVAKKKTIEIELG